MNKKLLVGIMSLAALAACTTDDFESQKSAQEMAGNVRFELVNGNDALTRAEMKGNTVHWKATDGDLFTLYFGAVAQGDLSGYENACYKAETDGSAASLSTPTMIKAGAAVMVWPVDTAFNIRLADILSVKIPANQKADIQNYLPYVSDQIKIGAYDEDAPYNTEGKDRTYPVYMRPVASQLNLKADYGTTEDEIATLYKGGSAGLSDDEAIEPITVTSIELLTNDGGTTKFSTKLPVTFTDATTVDLGGGKKVKDNWNAKKPINAWTHITWVDRATQTESSDKLTTKCLIADNGGAKFIILPQSDIPNTGVDKGAVRVNTYYGTVLVANPTDWAESKYDEAEYNNAWYRYVSTRVATATDDENVSSTTAEPAGSENAGKYKTVAKSVKMGMRQTINTFSDYKLANDAESTVAGENIGVSATRYLVVNLKHLDMSVLHIKTDKQLRDVARVWKTMGLDPVTVTLDGGEDGKFTITQKTIDVINSINPEGDVAPTFKVKPCQLPYADEEHGVCAQIVITENSGNATIKDVDFIAPGDGGAKVEVVFANEATAWNWAGNVKVDEAAVSRFINQGKMENSATATLKTVKSNGDQNNVLLENKGTWNVKSPATLTVQFNVYNRKTVNIAKGAQYRQGGSTATTFFNLATDKPSRFGGDDTKIGLVNNNGVFATVDNGNINNYGGLIEHLDKDAKTYITKNEQGGNFSSAFNDGTNRMGRINLKWSNKDEDNVSISAALNKGFVSVTVTSEDAPADGILNAAVVGDKVNYVIVNSGISTISAVSAQVKYLEINDPSKIQPNEIVWKVSAATTYQGLMILSDVNIALGTEISSEVTYLGATGTMYVGGTFNKGTTVWNGYYGDTSGNVVDNYVTY